MNTLLGVYYTIDQFRANPMPDEENSLTMTIQGKELDCDIGEFVSTKFRPVKINVSTTDEVKWAINGERLTLFCAYELQQWLTQRYTFHLEGEEYENVAFRNTDPFTQAEIVGVQYLTQAEIDYEVKAYGDQTPPDPIAVLGLKIETLREEALKIKLEIGGLEKVAEGVKSKLQQKQARLRILEVQLSQSESQIAKMQQERAYTELLNRFGPDTPFLHAIRLGLGGKESILPFIINGGHFDEVDKNGDNVLHYYCLSKFRGVETFVKLLEATEWGERLYARGQFGRTPLMCAVYMEKDDFVFNLLARAHYEGYVDGEDKYHGIEFADVEGDTALHYAARDNLYKIAKLLVDDGAFDSLYAKNDSGQTPLETALDDKIPVNAPIIDILTMDWPNAMKYGDEKYVELMLQVGVDPNITESYYDGNHYNALHYAALNFRTDLARVVLPRISEVNKFGIEDFGDDNNPDWDATRSTLSVTPLLLALWKYLFSRDERVVDFVKFLMDVAHVSLNMADNYRNFPIHLAVMANSTTLVNQLLLGDVDLNAVNDKGLTALALAESKNYWRIESILRNHMGLPPRQLIKLKL